MRHTAGRWQSNSPADNEHQSSAWKRSARRASIALGINALYLGLVVIQPVDKPPDAMDTETIPDTNPKASCNGLDIMRLDTRSNKIKVISEFTLKQGATYEGTSYIFDPDEGAKLDPHNQGLIHEYPTTSETQEHTVVGIINYSVSGSSDVFGSPILCEEVVRFVPQPDQA